MRIQHVVNTIFNSCSYVIGNDDCSWIVDCGDVDSILPLIRGKLCGVLLTHAHFDHIYGLNQLLSLYRDVPVFTNAAGLEALLSDKLNFSRYFGIPFELQYPENVKVVEDGQQLDLFEGVKALVVETPGHSPCCVTWMLDDVIFTGDSYIPGVKTVTNVPHSNKTMAEKSETLIRRLAEHRDIYPGHAASSEL